MAASDPAPRSVDSPAEPDSTAEDQAEPARRPAGVDMLVEHFVASLDLFLEADADSAGLIRERMSPGQHRLLVAEHLRSVLIQPGETPSQEASARVGDAHVRAGVPPSTYLSAYNRVFPCYHGLEPEQEVELPALGEVRRRWLHDVCSTLDSYHAALVAAWRNERSRLEASLAKSEARATQDDLTGVLRREAFIAQVEGSQCRGMLIVIDLDGFKGLNDRAGHLAGDLALTQVAAALQENVQEGDAVARLGGDEFGLWIEHAASPAAAETLLRRAEESLPLAEWGIGISAGCAIAPSGPRDFLDLYRRADIAMYRCKRTHERSIPSA